MRSDFLREPNTQRSFWPDLSSLKSAPTASVREFIRERSAFCHCGGRETRMSQEDTNDTRDYWKGRYLESVEARKQSDELVKQLFSQMRSQQGASTPIVVTGGSPTMTQMSSAIAALSSLLMVLFGTYSTATGADIGITMILIGAIFGTVTGLYLLVRRRDRPAKTVSAGAPPTP
jgi:hypothetical protein